MNKSRNHIFSVSALFFGISAFSLACQDSYSFKTIGEGGEPPAVIDVPNPFVPTPLAVDPDAPVYTDSFRQSSGSKVDILWVIDNSGSMSDDQNAIRNNAATFMSRLQEANIDFQLIVITTNSSHDPELQNQCGQILKSRSALLFATCAQVGTTDQNHAYHEEGLEAARRALDPEYPRGPWNTFAFPSPRNSGFLRPDADLHVIYVSDEEDQQDESSWTGKAGVAASDVTRLREEMAGDLDDSGHPFDTRYGFVPFVANHVVFLKGLKPAGGPKVRAHAIVTRNMGGTDACHTRSDGNPIEVGQRYSAVANLTGGSVTDICNSWTNTMDQIGLQTTGLDRCFPLSHVPTDPTSISVMIDGALVSAGEYEYVPTGNQVCFNSVPPSGSAGQVTYH